MMASGRHLAFGCVDPYGDRLLYLGAWFPSRYQLPLTSKHWYELAIIGHPRKGPAICGNSHIVIIKINSKPASYQPKPLQSLVAL